MRPFDARRLRRTVLRMSKAGSTVHVACAFSLVEMLAVLYRSHLGAAGKRGQVNGGPPRETSFSSARPLRAEAAPRRPHLLRPRRRSAVWPNPSPVRSGRPSGIHVSLIIIDGIVDEPSIRTKLAEKLDSFFVKPDDVADTALMLTRQKPSAWTFELEARPFGETW